ncbi:CCKAR [Branchiostoma lanceolatum]|uniref:CCKAR protein n=1 Tax=Branchiostoma lanceolatum TaxID=7740 RepID=A0A8K0A742_BRALA|nr:CCKAR [Branchiostoma lanceolatum]
MAEWESERVFLPFYPHFQNDRFNNQSRDNETYGLPPWLTPGLYLNNSMTSSELNNTHADVHIPIAAFLSVLCVCGILGNLLVIVVMIRKKQKLSSSFFILNMAIIDGVASAILIPLEVKSSLTMFNLFPNVETCRLFKWFECAAMLTSTFITVAIAVDRYLAICRPFKYASSQIKAATRARIAAASSVALGMVLPLPILPCYEFFNVNDQINFCELKYEGVAKYFVAWYQPVIVLLCVIIVIVLYTIVYLDIRRTRRRLSTKVGAAVGSNSRRPSSIQNFQVEKLTKKRPSLSPLGAGNNYRTVKLFVLVTFVFFFTWLPYCILNLNLGYLFLKTTTQLSINVFEVVSKLYLLNFILNPFIYAFVNKSFRQDCKQLFTCRKRRKPPQKRRREIYTIDRLNCCDVKQKDIDAV